ncbi:MAG: hypothetical protein VW270_19900, partial [Candidatus Poseidoniales archaeon]
MAIPTSPSVVVLENDVSIYTPNINSSVVGLVGFANKGPVNEATLITSQENLIRIFGKPDTTMQGQGLEGALEILEATNQLYYVRAIDSSATTAYASAAVAVGASPAVKVNGYTPSTETSSIYYSITDNAGATTLTGIVNFASSTNFKTKAAILENAFNPEVVSDQDVFAYVDGTDVYLASKFAGSGATFRASATGDITFEALTVLGAGDTGALADETASGYTASNVDLFAYSNYPGTGYNLTTLRDGTTQGISVEVNNLSTRDQIVINSDGAQVESFNNTELSPSGITSVEYILNDDLDNNQSEYVYVELKKDGVAYAAPNKFGSTATAAGFVDNAGNGNAAGTPRFVKVIEGTYGLADGDSGAADTSSVIGEAASKTGIYALDDDALNISIAATPGIYDDIVQNALVSLAETSKNFLALISPPIALGEVQDAIQWMNGQDPTARESALNSSYA